MAVLMVVLGLVVISTLALISATLFERAIAGWPRERWSSVDLQTGSARLLGPILCGNVHRWPPGHVRNA